MEEWLLPAEAGELEAEGMERTWRFSQADIVQVRKTHERETTSAVECC